MSPSVVDPVDDVKVNTIERLLEMDSNEFKDYMDKFEQDDNFNDKTLADSNAEFSELFDDVDLCNDENALDLEPFGQMKQIMLQESVGDKEAIQQPIGDEVTQTTPACSTKKVKRPPRSKRQRGLPREGAKRRKRRTNQMEKKRCVQIEHPEVSYLVSLLPDDTTQLPAPSHRTAYSHGASTGPMPPFTGPMPPFTGPMPPFTGPMPPFTGPMPPFTGPMPTFTGPMPTFTGPMPTFTGPRPPFTGPMPPFTDPRLQPYTAPSLHQPNSRQSTSKAASAPFQLTALREIPAWLPSCDDAPHVVTSLHQNVVHGGATDLQRQHANVHQAAQQVPHHGMAYSHGQPAAQASTFMGPVSQPMGCHSIGAAPNQLLQGSGPQPPFGPSSYNSTLVPGMSADFVQIFNASVETPITQKTSHQRSFSDSIAMQTPHHNPINSGATNEFVQLPHAPTHQFAPGLNTQPSYLNHGQTSQASPHPNQTSLVNPMATAQNSALKANTQADNGIDTHQNTWTYHNGPPRQIASQNMAPPFITHTVWPNQFRHL